jgi:hypothetical protein
MRSRFKSLYGKPKTLTDRYDECRPEVIADLLAKPEAQLGWNDFNQLFRVGVAPATYAEGLYSLPAAFAFLRRNPNGDAVNCVADVIWLLSEHATRLEKDRLLPECRETVLALLKERTGQFVVTHWDREKNRQMGRDREHYDYVEDSQLVCDTLEALFRFGTLRGWAGEFLEMLSCAQNEPLKSAWFLECVAAVSGWVFFRGKADPPATTLAAEKVCTAMPELRGVWEEFQKRGFVQNCPGQLVPDRALLERHADVIRNSGELFAKHPTYWAGLFRRLGLAREAPPEEGPAA